MADKIDAVTAESLQPWPRLQRVALRVFGSLAYPFLPCRHDLGDWQAQFQKYDVGTVYGYTLHGAIIPTTLI
jgi:hypothetical protein